MQGRGQVTNFANFPMTLVSSPGLMREESDL